MRIRDLSGQVIKRLLACGRDPELHNFLVCQSSAMAVLADAAAAKGMRIMLGYPRSHASRKQSLIEYPYCLVTNGLLR